MKTFREKLIEYGVYIAIFLTPILYFGNTRLIPHVTSKTFFFYGTVEIIGALWVYTILTDVSYRIPRKIFYILIPFFCYVGWLTVAGIFGVQPQMSFWSSLSRATGLLTLYHLILFLLIVVSLMRKKEAVKYLRTLLGVFLGSAFIVAVSVWLGDEGFNFPYEFLQKSKGGGLIGNSSLTAMYLTFAFFFGLFLLFEKSIISKRKIWIGSVLGAIMLSPLFVNIYSIFTPNGFFISARGALLSIGVGAWATCLGYLILSKKRLLKIAGISGVGISIGGFIYAWRKLITPGTLFYERLSEFLSNRLLFWDSAKRAIDAHPMFGWGPENYTVAYRRYFDPHIYLGSDTIELWNDRAHNIFFDTGVSGGWPAIIFLVAFFLSILYMFYRAYRIGAISRIQTAITGGLLTAYIFQSLFIFDSLLSLLGLIILTAIGCGLYANSIFQSEKRLLGNKWRPLAIIGIAVALIFVWITCTWLPSRKATRFAAVVSMPLNTRLAHYGNLLKGSPVGDGREVGGIAHDMYLVYAKNKVQLKNDTKKLPFVIKDLESLLSYLEIVARKQSYDSRLYVSMAELYNTYIYLADKQADTELVRHVLEIEDHAHALSPADPQIDWVRAETEILSGEYTKAEESFKHAISLAPYIKHSHLLLLDFAQKRKDAALYSKTLSNAANAIPGFSLQQ